MQAKRFFSYRSVRGEKLTSSPSQKGKMAYEAVVTSVAERLDDLLIQEAPLFRDDITWIHTELETLRSFMQDADSRRSEEEKVKNWVAQIRDLCYDLEDVLDTFIFSLSAKKGDGFLERLKRPFSVISKRRTHHEVAKQMERLKQKMRDIKIKREDYGIININEGRREASSSTRRLEVYSRSSALFQESEVVGLQDEIETLREQLINGEVRRSVISIVGMGGIGKTTLARKVYHDVKDNFDCHAFIYLSQNYKMKDVVMRIIERVMRLSQEEKESLDEEELKRKLCDHLKQKRYLLAVDDIWSIEAWDDLKLILPAASPKSRVMLTTRIKKVALHADSLSNPHEMRLLDDDKGWELFMKKIFPVEENPSTACPSNLKEIGRRILVKCGGLPLAILVLGGLLARKEKTERAWSGVLESVNWHHSGSFERCRKILALSYWDLPHYLKPCFLYLGLFPEDSEIGSGRLIRLWIAEGFIKQRDNQIMEDVAYDFLEELVDRSMIQVASRKSNGFVGKCRLHNLLREFSLSEARQIDFFAIHNSNDASSSLTSVRRLALYGRVDEYNTTATRSIFCFSGSEVPLSQLLNIGGKLLRVLVAEDAKEQSFKEVGECVNLRYLELARMDGSLPSSIGNLSNLRTLKLSFSGTLSNAIWNLAQLRHLSCFYFTTDEHPKLNKLRDLQTLKLSAGSWIGDGLDKLSNLRKLGIRGDLRSHHKALFDSIDKLSYLHSLKLCDGHSMPPFESFSSHSVLYKMYLDGRIQKLPMWPPNLTELTLRRSLLGPDAISTLGKLPHLKILKLLRESFVGNRMICSQEGGFPCLELLTLSELPLECLDVEDGAMMSLKSVELFDVSKLETETLPKRVQSILTQI